MLIKRLTFNHKILGLNLSLPDEQSNRERSRRIAFYSICSASFPKPTIISFPYVTINNNISIADIQIPIVAKLTSDSPEEVMFAATCTSSNHIIVVHKNAKKVSTLLCKRKKSVCSKNSDDEGFQNRHLLFRGLMRYFKTDQQKALVREFLKKCIEKVIYAVSTCPIYVCFGSSFCIIINLYVIVKKSDYDVEKLIMMQNLKPRTAGLKPMKIGDVDSSNSRQGN